jgi:phosphate transport system substrate-binding protein
VIARGVSGDKGALGYFGLSYLLANESRLKAVAVDGGDGCVMPSVETVQSAEYKPLSRPLFYYVSNKAIARPEVKGFVEYSVNSSNEISEASKIVPMSQEQLDKSKQALTSAGQ